MKLVVLCVTLAVAVAEPPVDNRYLPPAQGFGTPPPTYGTPQGFQKQTDAIIRQPSNFQTDLSNQYLPPDVVNQQLGSRQPNNLYVPPPVPQQPNNQYGAPATNRQPNNLYGAPANRRHSNHYGAPATNRQPNNMYGTPENRQPNNLYGAPETRQPTNQYGAPKTGQSSNQYGAPATRQPNNQYGAPATRQPSNLYGAPNSFGNQYQGQNQGSSGSQSRQYLPPGVHGGDEEEYVNETPANYNFQYMVKDAPSGNDFGHRESRMGNRAEGEYYVLLPDGRKQIVRYEADENGYKPKITYEDTNSGYRNGGYNNAGYNNGGYNNGGYNNGGYNNGGSNNGPY